MVPKPGFGFVSHLRGSSWSPRREAWGRKNASPTSSAPLVAARARLRALQHRMHSVVSHSLATPPPPQEQCLAQSMEALQGH